LFLRWLLAEYDAARATADVTKILPTIRQSITWAKQAMYELTPETIKNCWKKAVILPLTNSADIAQENTGVHAQRETSKLALVGKDVVKELADLISALDLDKTVDKQTPEEYIMDVDENIIEEEIDVKEMVCMASGDPMEVDVDVASDDEEPPAPPTLAEAREQVKNLARFVEENVESMGESFHTDITALMVKLDAMTVTARTRQVALTKFYSIKPSWQFPKIFGP